MMKSMQIKHEQQIKELREEMEKKLEAAKVNKDKGLGKTVTELQKQKSNFKTITLIIK